MTYNRITRSGLFLFLFFINACFIALGQESVEIYPNVESQKRLKLSATFSNTVFNRPYAESFLHELESAIDEYGIDIVNAHHFSSDKYLTYKGYDRINRTPDKGQIDKLRNYYKQIKDKGVYLVVSGEEPLYPRGLFDQYPEMKKVDNGKFWQFVEDKTKELYDVFPEMDCFEIYLWETNMLNDGIAFPELAFDRHNGYPYYSESDYLKYLFNAYARAAYKKNKEFMLLSFSHYPYQEDIMIEALKNRDRNFPFLLDHKCQPGDWVPFKPANRIMQTITDMPGQLQFDGTGEYWGQSLMPFCYPEEIQARIQHALSQNPNITTLNMRINWMYGSLFGKPNEINFFALSRLAEDPFTPIEKIWEEWAVSRYGEKAAAKVISALKRTDDIGRRIFYIDGIWAFNHTSFAGLGYAESHLVNYARCTAQLKPDDIMGNYRLNALLNYPREYLINEILADRDEAIRLVELSLKDIEEVRSFLTKEKYTQLNTQLKLLRDMATASKLHAEALFRYRIEKLNAAEKGKENRRKLNACLNKIEAIANKTTPADEEKNPFLKASLLKDYVKQIKEAMNHLVPNHQSPWGVSAHPTSPREWPQIDVLTQRLKEANIKWVREDFKFSYICQDKDTFRFARYDSLLAVTEANGINVLPILQAYDNEIKPSRPELVPVYQHPEQWRAFIRETVTRYHHKIKYWEIWNEQDGGFWKPAPDAAQYVPLLKIAYEEIKKIDPECQVVVGGLCSWNADYLQSMYNEGAQGYFDILAVHPYNFGPDVNLLVRRMRNEVLDVIKKNDTKEIPVWITEFGGTSFSGQLAGQQPAFMIDAIRFALKKLNKPSPEKLTIGVAVSPRITDMEEVVTTRSWLPGINLVPIPFDKLHTIDPTECPILLGAEGLNIDEPMMEPLRNYVIKGGLLVAANKVPFYTTHYQDKRGVWQREDRPQKNYAFFRMNFEAFWTKKGVPGHTNTAQISEIAKEAGLPEVSDIYVDRFLDDKNKQEGDHYYPIIRAYDKDRLIGDGMALYTYNDWKGGILLSTLSVESGYTEEEQANLLQRVYLTYLMLGVDKLFWYDLHNDGPLAGEREHNFGLLHYDFSPKKAYYAYKEMTDALGKNPVFIKRLTGKDPNTWVLIFKKEETAEEIATIWSTKEKGYIQVITKEGRNEKVEIKNTKVKFLPLNSIKKLVL